MTWALLITGTASKSKVSRVLPGGSFPDQAMTVAVVDRLVHHAT
jgi:hypothetical protein